MNNLRRNTEEMCSKYKQIQSNTIRKSESEEGRAARCATTVVIYVTGAFPLC